MRWQLKIILLIIILPFILLNKENTSGFDLTNCEAIEKTMYSYAVYFFELFFSLWILIYAIYKYKKVDSSMQKQIIFLIIGIEFFLFSFFVTGYISSILTVNSYNIEFYGLFGMTFFMGMLAYLIVRFEAFNIKMIGAQALVVGLVILIGSQFFFIRSFINQILTGITLALSIVFGWALIHSVKLEVERKNELQRMSNSLALANDKLRKLDNAKSEFISIASHQLRTPLTAIKGFISLILEDSYGKVSAEIRDVLNKVYISNERLIELVEDLLNLSRIESGRMEYTFEKTNFNELCQEIYDTFALRAKEKELRLELVLPQNSTAEAVTDRSKVREVISNMVDNALKYTIKGGVKMKVSENERNILVAIIDTGIGVPEEEIPYLFSKFSRGKDINRLNAGGTGLGLHVARKVMEAVGGRIWVESAGTNLGSTFFLEIPKEHAEIN
ncbi:MAG: HAMP domain-containing sensor histidine kinase [Parcubacteria group bacterium]